MGNSLTFPVPGNLRAGDKLSRWLGRWRRGGIEQYSSAVPAEHSARWHPGDRFTVNDERIWLDALPSAFHGLRVVQISDIHHGLFLPKEWLSEAVRQANRLEPDIIALTGDFVTYSKRNIGPAAELLGRLRARYGVYAVLGNHDFRVDATAITDALRREHIDVLRNRHVALWFGGESVYLAGRRRLRVWRGSAAGHARCSARRCHGLAGAQSARDPFGLSSQRKPGSFRAHPWRTGELAPSWHGVRALAGALALQNRLGPHGGHSDLCKPRHRHHRSAMETPLPSGNHPSGAAPRRLLGSPLGSSRLIPQGHARR